MEEEEHIHNVTQKVVQTDQLGSMVTETEGDIIIYFMTCLMWRFEAMKNKLKPDVKKKKKKNRFGGDSNL